jgi:hypothetical protein
MSETLSERLRRLRVQTLIREAELIRDDPPGALRTKEAHSLIYTVMYQSALGRLTSVEKQQILSIIDFARESHAPAQQEALPRIHPLD